jgi:hypothetical protein
MQFVLGLSIAGRETMGYFTPESSTRHAGRLRVVSEVPPLQESGRERRAAEGPAVDQLNFLDLLYAVPVGDLAMRVSGAKLAQVSSADWWVLAVILATIAFSWIGVHKDRAAQADESHQRGPIGKMPFLGLQFVQFLVQIIIVGTYFAMGLFLKLPTQSDPTVRPPAEGWLTGFLLLIFGLYLLWDLIDIRLAGSSLWRKPALDGTLVTASFLILAGIIFVVVLFACPPAILSNAILLIFLYAYRVAQDRWGNCGEIKAETVIIFITGD